MRIGIDARMFGPRVGGGGLGRYVAELVTHLQEIDRDTEYVVFLKKENFHDFIVKQKNFSKRLVDIPWYGLREQLAMPREILLSKVHAMHYPHWNVPVLSKVPFVVTIHDLILLNDPHSAHASTQHPLVHGVKFAAFRHVLEHAVYKSRHIVAVSHTTRADILRHFRVRPERISTIYQGVRAPSAGAHVSLERLAVTAPYILALGNMYPHKNHEVLVRALAHLKDMPEVSLVCAGKYDAFAGRVKQLAEQLGVADRVRFVHAPTDAEVHALLANAALLAYPSRQEGFGIPPLEAMLVRTPTAVSDIPVFHETLGESTQFVPVDDYEAWAAVMRHAVTRPETWKPLITSGMRVAKRYTWKACAEAMKEMYLRNALPRL